MIYEANLDEEASLNHPLPSERVLSLTIPPEAQATVKTPLYDPIGWAVVLRRPRANASDVELDFPFEVIKQTYTVTTQAHVISSDEGARNPPGHNT